MIQKEMVNHPKHYQGCKFEVIDIIEAYNLGFCLGNSIKYLLRAGKKDDIKQEVNKAIWYIQRYEQERIQGKVEKTQIVSKTNLNTIEEILKDFQLQEDIGKAVRSILISTQVSQDLEELEEAKKHLYTFLENSKRK